jgi:tetratricopeptide (TPR) repeat protein
MMRKKLAGLVLAVCITATPGLAQTTTELLQKGIYAQETEGNLDNAILIYRQIVNSAPSQRDLAAQAQFRLAQALLQKGDLTSAAQEFDKLATDYSDYRNLVGSLSAQNSKREEHDRQAIEAKFLYNPPAAALAGMTFDDTKPFNVTGKVTRLDLSSSVSTITVDGPSSHIFALAAAADMMKQGFNRTALKPGDEVNVWGVPAAGGQVIDGALASRADVVIINGTTLFDRSKLVAPAYANGDKRQEKLEMVLFAMNQLQVHLKSILILRARDQPNSSDNDPDILNTKAQIAKLATLADALKKEIAAGGN